MRLAQVQCGYVTDHPNMTSAVYRGRKALTQIQKVAIGLSILHSILRVDSEDCLDEADPQAECLLDENGWICHTFAHIQTTFGSCC